MTRLGVAGHGNRISGVIKGLLREIDPDIRVVAIVDPDQEGARSRLDKCDEADVAFYDSMDDMVRQANLDALAVGTRCNLHAPYAIEAARYDLPMYLEKPVAISMVQATQLEDAYENAKCQVVVSFPLRVSPLCVLTRDHIDKNCIGSAEHIASFNYVPYGTCYWDAGYRNHEITQGLFIQKATHDFDYMTYLMGANVVRIAAMSTCGRVFGGQRAAGQVCSSCDEALTCLESPANRKKNGSGGTQADHPCLFSVDCGSPETGMNEDSSSAIVQFASGVHGIYTQVFYSRRDAGTRGATVSGYHGTLNFDWYTNELRWVRHHQPFTSTTRAGEGMSHFGGDIELAHDFIGILRGTRQSRTPVQAGIQSVYTCLAAKESAETGQFVDVRQVGAAGS